MDFKDVLKRERIARGLTQEELGALVGLKKSAIHKYENGLNVNPGRSLIFKFAQALNISPCYLLTGESNTGSENDNLTDVEFELISNFRKLNSTGQEIAIDQLKLLINQPTLLAEIPKSKEVVSI